MTAIGGPAAVPLVSNETGEQPSPRVEEPRYVLLNPGPVVTTDLVKAALSNTDVCHRDSDYTELLRQLEGQLLEIFRAPADDYEVLFLTGSGTSAIEASISTTIPRGKRLLVVSNGAFAERIQEIAEIHGVAAEPLRYPWGAQLNPVDVARRLEDDPDIFAVAAVHHETSVGVLNAIRPIGETAQAHDRLFMVDCVSSLGAEDLDLVRDRVDLAVGCANKCLHAVSGVSFVSVNKRVWDRSAGAPRRSMYLDLRAYRHYQYHLGQAPFTPSVACLAALEQASRDLLAEGVDARIRSYRERNCLVREGLVALGLRIANVERASHTLTCVELPSYLSFTELYRGLKNEGFIIYNSKAHLEDKVFQVANMGALTRQDLLRFLASLDKVLSQHQPRAAEVTDV